MSYNATVDTKSLDLFNNFKYDKNPSYDYKLRNIKYFPNDPNNIIEQRLLDDSNAMIVRYDDGYYEKSRSYLNNGMNPVMELKMYKIELSDNINIYNRWQAEINKLKKTNDWTIDYSDLYEPRINKLFIPNIIRLNEIILEKSAKVNHKKIEYDKILDEQLYIYLICVMICIFLIIILLPVNYYKI